MSDIALFELDVPVWTPLYHPRGPWEDRGENATESTAEEWKAYQRAQRCRDCGTRLSKCKRMHSCGGAGSDGQYDLCDDCAAIDGCHPWNHEIDSTTTQWKAHQNGYEFTRLAGCSCGWELIDYGTTEEPWTGETIADAISEHVALTESSRWGMPHTASEHAHLTDLQASRRAKYLREVSS